LGERLHQGGDATACAVVAQRQGQGHDGSFDLCWRLRRMGLGSFRAFFGPGSIGSVVAIPPLIEPALRAGQLSRAILNLVLSKVWVDGLVTTVYGAWGQRPCLCQQRLSLSEHDLFSMSWHTTCHVPGVLQAWRRDSWCTRTTWRRQPWGTPEQESMSNQSHGSGRTT
jgi:hypothetical protein